MGKKISIITPAFNMERFIEQAVLSAVEQNGISLRDMEILVVNDGSQDSTEAIVEGLIKKHGDFIRLISLKANTGVLTATIEGLKKASGEYICLLDADDVWARNKLSEVTSCFEAGYDLVFHEGEFVDSNGNFLNKYVRCVIPDDLIAYNIKSFNGGTPLGSSISFRRSKLDLKLLIPVYESFREKNMEGFVYQDSAILHALMSGKDINIKCIRKSLYGYRVHESNSSLNSDFDNVERLREIFNKGLHTTLFAVEIYRKSGLYYEDKSIETGSMKFLYCKNFSLREKNLFALYRDYYFLLKNNAFIGKKEQLTKFIYPLFFRLPVKIRKLIRGFF